MTDLATIVAGGVGAVARYAVGTAIFVRFGGERPIGTLIVNVVGAFAIGLVLGGHSTGTTPLVIGGFLGGFTTFSTWMVESVVMAVDGTRSRRAEAAVNVGGMLVLGVVAAVVGTAIA